MRVLFLGSFFTVVAIVFVAPAQADILSFTGSMSYGYSLSDYAVLGEYYEEIEYYDDQNDEYYVDYVYHPEEVLLDEHSSYSSFDPAATLEFWVDPSLVDANGVHTNDALGSHIRWDLVLQSVILNGGPVTSYDGYISDFAGDGTAVASTLLSGLRTFSLDLHGGASWSGSTQGGGYNLDENTTLTFTGGGTADSGGGNNFVFDILIQGHGYAIGASPFLDGERTFEQWRTVTDTYHMEMALQNAPIPARQIVPEPATAVLVTMGLLLPLVRRLGSKLQN